MRVLEERKDYILFYGKAMNYNMFCDPNFERKLAFEGIYYDKKTDYFSESYYIENKPGNLRKLYKILLKKYKNFKKKESE